MKIEASAGADRKKDLRTFCYSLWLVAQTDEEAADLASFHSLLHTERISTIVEALKQALRDTKP